MLNSYTPSFFNPQNDSERIFLTLFSFLRTVNRVYTSVPISQFIPPYPHFILPIYRQENWDSSSCQGGQGPAAVSQEQTRTLTQVCSIPKHVVFTIELSCLDDDTIHHLWPPELSLVGQIRKETDHYKRSIRQFVDCSPSWDLSMYFLMIRLGFLVWGRVGGKTTEVKYPSH